MIFIFQRFLSQLSLSLLPGNWPIPTHLNLYMVFPKSKTAVRNYDHMMKLVCKTNKQTHKNVHCYTLSLENLLIHLSSPRNVWTADLQVPPSWTSSVWTVYLLLSHGIAWSPCSTILLKIYLSFCIVFLFHKKRKDYGIVMFVCQCLCPHNNFLNTW
jgi:hypothetical protein